MAQPASVAAKINRERVVLLGWGRAILLQLAHPLVAAGVADHSDFRANPLGYVRRTRRTVEAMLILTFGSEQAIARAAAQINSIHDRVHGVLREPAGPFPAGTPYSAHDPELLAWVHATLLDTLPLTYERFVERLTPAEKDAYCAEATAIGPLLGIPDRLLPTSTRELGTYMDAMYASGRIVVTDTSRRLARALLFPRFASLLGPVFGLGRLTTIGLLPPAIRRAYGFVWTDGQERRLSRWAAVVRRSRMMAPPVLREWAAARAA